jgi:pyruvate/2-oxoglutarate dehydrogenase complex dihydrolipoamide dehydrogenase (E3) component
VAPLVLPDDEENRRLVAQVHPPGWTNPTPSGRYDLVVVGAGTAGLVAAAGGAGLGARVALVERHLLGGDCLNVGCVPSKAVIAASRVAANTRGATAFGVRVSDPEIDFGAVMARMRRLRAGIAPNDGAPRFAGLGVDVYLGAGRFTGPRTLEVDGQRLDFKRAVVATGARAAAPPIPGIEETGYLTNETVFSLTERPARLVVIGAGPIGCELAQAFCRLGSRVTVVERVARILEREEPDAAAVVDRRLRADGVDLVLGANVLRAERRGGDRVLVVEAGGTTREIACDAILVGVGRVPNVEGLGLDAAGVAHDKRGVTVDDHLRTTNPRIWAAGDIASRFQFTHVADFHARIVLANALFLGRRKASALHIPACTYTSPELARVGLSAAEAAEGGIAIDTITVPLHDVDRARLDGEDEGLLRVHVAKGSDRIVGATLVAAHAGDIISELTLAMATGIGLGRIANVIHPYPTVAEAIRKAGDAYNRTRLTPRVKRIFSLWLRFRP